MSPAYPHLIVNHLPVAGALVASILLAVAVRRRTIEGAVYGYVALVVAAVLGTMALTTASPTFWPLTVFAAVVPWLPLPGRPPSSQAMLLASALLATTIVTHAVFFGEDRYHIVVTPVLALMAAAALRRPA